jgi:hypothetical protein
MFVLAFAGRAAPERWKTGVTLSNQMSTNGAVQAGLITSLRPWSTLKPALAARPPGPAAGRRMSLVESPRPAPPDRHRALMRLIAGTNAGWRRRRPALPARPGIPPAVTLGQWKYWPPLMSITDPVTKLDSVEASHSTALATSSGIPGRPSGIAAIVAALASAVVKV